MIRILRFVLPVFYWRSLILFCLPCLALVGCSAARTNTRFAGTPHGPIVLSSTNPYLMSNLILGREAEKNSVLEGFLGHRGVPDALEIKREFATGENLWLYYLESGETYALQETRDGPLVRGPFEIDQKVLDTFKDLPRKRAVPPLLVHGKVIHGQNKSSEVSAQEERQLLKRQQTKQSSESDQIISNDPTVQLAKKSRGTRYRLNQSASPPDTRVLISPSGDIQHCVTYSGETLRLISEWYTGDVNNTDRLARINDLQDPNLLAIGQQIRIPRYLLKQTTPLPYSAVEERRKLFQGSH